MLRKRVNSRAQSISEYVLVIGLVSAALVGMQVYMKRGIQAVIKDSADELGIQEDSEERNFQPVTKQSSQTNTVTGPATRRMRESLGGGNRVDFETTANTTGTQTYESEQ
jgi:hypothetical protein